MYTTITVNGPHGYRLLDFLGARFTGRMPPVLACLVDEDLDALEVETELAEEVAVFVDRLIAVGVVASRAEPPLLFSPSIGDEIAVVRDMLVEIQPRSPRAPQTWRYLARGTHGRLVAREHDGTGRVLLLDGAHREEIAFVRNGAMTGVRFWWRPSGP